MASKSELFPLKGTFQKYPWGKEISKSILAGFAKTQPEMPSSGTVAELWLGSHPNGESEIKIENAWQPLKNFLESKPELSEFNFLTKILCINKPLSIQLHPNAKEALRLNLNNPTNFPDSNPKPEMAVALSDLELLCGVRPVSEIIELVENHVAFKSSSKFDPSAAIEEGGISKLFEVILTLDNDELNRILGIFRGLETNTPHDSISKSLIETKTSLDPGILALHLLSFLKIKKGEAIYIKPNIPHAYISGEAFECMKNSDNVVRGGLTSKTIDVENFCRLVETQPYNPKLTPHQVNSHTVRYLNDDLPFLVDQIQIKTNSKDTLELKGGNGHEIILVTAGSGNIELSETSYDLLPGSSFYCCSRTSMNISGEELSLFRILAK